MPQVFNFPWGVVKRHLSHVESVFNEDGSRSVFYPPVGKADFEDAARYAGYVDSHQFGIEHDILHHYLARIMGWSRSHVVWWDAHDRQDDPDSQELRDLEEHVVVRMQRRMNMGIEDDYGVLQDKFGEALPTVTLTSILLVRPWLGSGSFAIRCD